MAFSREYSCHSESGVNRSLISTSELDSGLLSAPRFMFRTNSCRIPSRAARVAPEHRVSALGCRATFPCGTSGGAMARLWPAGGAAPAPIDISPERFLELEHILGIAF